MDREVRYCTTEDGVRIAYCVEGEGPALVCLPLFLESFSLDHLLPDHRDFMRALGEGRQIIRFDPRGIGLSQRDVQDVTYAGFVCDLEAVVRACGLRRLALWAATTLGVCAIEYAARQPTELARLVLYGTYASVPAVFPPAVTRSFVDLTLGNWELAAQIFADMTGRKEFPQAALSLAEWYRRSTTGELAAKRIQANLDWDATERLAQITVPTLVLHRRNDPTFRFELGNVLAEHIPNSRFLPLEGEAHLPAFGDSESILRAVQEFLDEDPETRRRLPEEAAPEEHLGAFRTVLFTDLVGHTAMMRRLGDERGRAVLREHERITREVLKAHGGAEVKTMGDGFMASFGSVTSAVNCAIALQKAVEEWNQQTSEQENQLSVCVGLNAGEPIEEDGDLFGETVIVAARIAGMAQGGEVLASLAVRELCAGKGFAFADLGEHAMRGFEDPVRVFEIKRPV